MESEDYRQGFNEGRRAMWKEMQTQLIDLGRSAYDNAARANYAERELNCVRTSLESARDWARLWKRAAKDYRDIALVMTGTLVSLASTVEEALMETAVDRTGALVDRINRGVNVLTGQQTAERDS